MSYLDKLKADDELAMKVAGAGIMGSSEAEVAVWMLERRYELPSHIRVVSLEDLLDSLVTQVIERQEKSSHA